MARGVANDPHKTAKAKVLWAEGKTLRQIRDLTGLSLSAVQRLTVSWENIRKQEIEGKKPEVEQGPGAVGQVKAPTARPALRLVGTSDRKERCGSGVGTEDACSDAKGCSNSKQKPKPIATPAAVAKLPLVPTGPTQGLTDAFCAYLVRGTYPETACDGLGLTMDRYREWVERGVGEIERLAEEQGAIMDPDEAPYATFVLRTRQSMAVVESAVVEELLASSDWKAKVAWLKGRHPQRWGDKQDVTLKGDPKEPLFAVTLSTEEMLARFDVAVGAAGPPALVKGKGNGSMKLLPAIEKALRRPEEN